MESFILRANDLLWNHVLIFCLLFTGIFLSVKLKFVQLRRFKFALSALFGKESRERAHSNGISPFQAFSTAVAAQVGTGNIVGVASAIACGGPGAAFWMMLSAFFGMATIFTEAVLAQTYREERNGIIVGGPAYYIRNGMKNKYLAYFFSFSCIAASMAIGIMVQSNAITKSIGEAFSVPMKFVSVGVVLVAGMILIGGLKRIASFAEKIVPFMAMCYILATITILFKFHRHIPDAVTMIFEGAFRPEAIGGGALGIGIRQTVRYGLARGLFSNEAGMGSTPHSHAVARAKHPADQGFVAMIGVFISTFLICMSTVVINLVSGSYDPNVSAAVTAKSYVLMTQKAFVISFGPKGEIFLSICLSMFALTTIVGWYYFAESNVRFIFNDKKWIIGLFKAIVMVLLFKGGMMATGIVWDLADFFMALMVLPNILALLMLSSKSSDRLKEWEALRSK